MKPCVVLIIAPFNFDKDQYHTTKQALENNYTKAVTASTRKGQAVAHTENTYVVAEQDADTVTVDCTIDEIDPLSYQGVFIIGGPGALEYLDITSVHETIQATYNFDLYYGGIGRACRILARTNVIEGKTATGWNDDSQLQHIYDSYNCTYDNQNVIVSDKMITAREYAGQQFGTTIAEHVSWY